MNRNAGSKKFIMPVAAAGTTVSNIIRTEKIQNIPNKALGNFMEAATKACFKNWSAASMIPSDTNKCVVANTLREIVVDVFSVPAPSMA